VTKNVLAKLHTFKDINHHYRIKKK